MQSLLIAICWFFFGLFCSKIAKNKNRNTYVWFILGILFGLLSLIIIYFLKPLRSTSINTILPTQGQILDIPENDNNYWYYLDHEKKQIGPLSINKIFNNYLEKVISEDTYVWNDTMSTWIKFKEVPIFKKSVQSQSQN